MIFRLNNILKPLSEEDKEIVLSFDEETEVDKMLSVINACKRANVEYKIIAK